jgi:hypothetical protein
LKQQLEETGTELQVKEKELKKIKFQALLNNDSTGKAAQGANGVQYSKTMADKPRLSEGFTDSH